MFWNNSKSINIEFVKSERDDAKKAADGELVLAIDKYWRAIKVVTQCTPGCTLVFSKESCSGPERQ